WDRNGTSDAGVRRASEWVLHAIHACAPTEPKIAIERGPEPWLEVVAQVPFEGPNWVLRLRPGTCIVDVARPEISIRGEEPHSKVPIEHPFAPPAFGIAKLRFKRPPVGTPIDQLDRVVLAGWGDHLETGAQQDFLLPFHELLRRHGRTALKIDGEAKGRIQETRTVQVLLRAECCSTKSSHAVRQ